MSVTARIQPQEWMNEKLSNTTYDYVIDCEKALDAIPFEKLPFRCKEIDLGALDYGGDIAREAEKLGLVPEWPGPIQFYILDSSEYDAYFSKRMIVDD